jgi:gluconate 2-dehydrogenase subunit 3-like protein
MIPADGAGDWSAATIGVGDYIDRLLLGFDGDTPNGGIYAGGPYRCQFPSFQALPAAKRKGWQLEIERLRKIYREGLAALDAAAGGDFAALPEVAQDAILEGLDLQGSELFRVLYNHTMEGAYSHPVYGGNRDFTSWSSLQYQGDVHGVRFPSGEQDLGADAAPWDRFGGYSPDDMIQPGPGPGPITDTGKCST